MPFRLGPTELLIILAIVMIIFGVGRLPEIGNAMGKAVRGFRKGMSLDEDITSPLEAGSSNGTRPSRRRGNRSVASTSKK